MRSLYPVAAVQKGAGTEVSDRSCESSKGFLASCNFNFSRSLQVFPGAVTFTAVGW